MKSKRLLSLAISIALAVSIISVPSAFADERTEWYNQYVKAAEKVTNETGSLIEVIPMDEFTEEDWVEPEKFEDNLRRIANAKFTISNDKEEGISLLSAGSASKTVDANITDGTVIKISINGSFKTQYSEETQRQLFSGITSITSSEISSNGTWSQSGYDYSVWDAGRTYDVTVFGKLTLSGAVYVKSISTEFYCSATGAVS
jgi:peroxiredoxin